MPLPRPTRHRSPIATTGSDTHSWPGDDARRQRDVGADHGAAPDADVALVDQRRRPGSRSRCAHRTPRTGAPAGTAARSPRAPGSAPTRGGRARRRRASGAPPPGATACRGPRAGATRRATLPGRRRHRAVAAWRRARCRGSRRADHRHPLRGGARCPAAVARGARLAGGSTLPTSWCTPATSCSRIPTTTSTGPSPSRCSTGARPLRRDPGQPRHRLLRRGGRPAAPARHLPWDVGRRPLRPSTSPAGASSAPMRTCSARPTTTPGCARR